MTDLVAKMTQAKRNFRWLDQLVPDATLARALQRDTEAEDAAGPLTLAGCLVHHDDYPAPFPPRLTLVALDNNPGALWDKIQKQRQLRNT